MSGTPRSDVTVAKVVEVYQRTKSKLATSLELGVDRQTVERRLRQNTAQDVMPPPDGQVISGVSTLYNAEGRVSAQWVKTKTDLDAQLRATVQAITEAFEDAPKVKKIEPPKACNKRLLTVYPIGDQHHGCLSYGEETGADYDVKISERVLTSAAAHLVAVAPESETAIVLNCGDFFHVDNLKNVTSHSGNVLDVDTRYSNMIRGGVRLMRTVVECALAKHKFVKVVCVTGNHDEIGAMWLQTALSLLYEQNKRVSVETKPGKFHYHQHGKVLLGFTHGDTGKPEKLSGVMAADQPKMWGETEFRYWLTGHVHTRRVVEFPGVMWETFRTLAAPDAWAKGAGYRSGRDMTAIVLHDQFGEIARHRFDVAMLAA